MNDRWYDGCWTNNELSQGGYVTDRSMRQGGLLLGSCAVYQKLCMTRHDVRWGNFCVTAYTNSVHAAFTAAPTNGAAHLGVQFSDASLVNPTAWAWDMDNNGATDYITQHAQLTYPAAGTYSVWLTVSNGMQAAALTKTAYVVAGAPTAPAAPVFLAPTAYAHRVGMALQRNSSNDLVAVINNSECKQRVALGELQCAGVWKRVLTGMAKREALELEAVAGEILVPAKRQPRG